MASMVSKAATIPRASNPVQPETALTLTKLWNLDLSTLQKAHKITSSEMGRRAGISVFGLPLLGMNKPNAELGEAISSTIKRGDGTTLTFSILIPEEHRGKMNADIAVYDFEMLLNGNGLIFVPKETEGAVKVGSMHSGKLGLPEDIAIDFLRDAPRVDVQVPRIVIPTIGYKEGLTYYNVIYAGGIPNAPHGIIPTGSKENVLTYLVEHGVLVKNVLFDKLSWLGTPTDPISKLMTSINTIAGVIKNDRPVKNLREKATNAENAVVSLLSNEEIRVSENSMGVLVSYVAAVKLNLPVIDPPPVKA